MKQTWSTIDTILNRNNKKRKLPQNFYLNGLLTNNTNNIVNSFNEYFCNIGPKLASSIKSNPNKYYKHYLKHSTNSRLRFKPADCTAITKIINELNAKHSTGLDGLSTKLLQQISRTTYRILNYHYQPILKYRHTSRKIKSCQSNLNL